MPTHNDPHPGSHADPRTGLPGAGGDLGKAPGKDLSKVPNRDAQALHSIGEGYEITDVSVSGVGVFLVALAVTIVIFFIFAFGMGKVMNTVLRHSDQAPNAWQAAGVSTTGGVKGNSMESSPVIEQKQLHQLVQTFPTPRLQTDDGDQDLTDLHAREDLLLGHYSYVDAGQGKVRIPIDRAMQLIAQRGLPVAPQAGSQTARMYGDMPPTVQVPLTSGFARTGYEQERNSAIGLAGDQSSAKANDY